MHLFSVMSVKQRQSSRSSLVGIQCFVKHVQNASRNVPPARYDVLKSVLYMYIPVTCYCIYNYIETSEELCSGMLDVR